ncbi:entericidin A/B family lipoprotein [Pusillimonas sp. CC-YST705]|uniref:Entericidin A/B family lipoprotein n=1 Tax=Mesopusillimonas faecipullorum TaxID=2755040 RepID=A0ABS8CF90_9BURK|nr:entericidin A/B family lipoprotein [Mesopusillimonas faecipullorum]MCB5364716.1 entericidin A/B family lipoprotein [Mesopusillimonas faecipullorum]
MKKASWLLAAVSLLMTGLLAGCHTVEGFGKDVERGGESIQNAAK